MATDTGPGPRSGAGLTFDANLGQILLFGGGDGDLHSDTWSWDGSKWSLVQTSHSPAPRMRAGLTYHAGLGGSLLFGGVGLPSDSGTLLADTWLFDGGDWTRIDCQAAPPPGDARGLTYSPTQGAALLYATPGGKARDADGSPIPLAATSTTWQL